MTVKNVTYTALVSGLLLAPLAVSAEHPYPEGRDLRERVKFSKAGAENPFPDQSKSNDYGVAGTV